MLLETASQLTGDEGLMAQGTIPRLSVAIATPPSNFTAMTEVPVTAGDCV